MKQESRRDRRGERFLPKQMSEDEMKTAIAKAISATGAASIKDMGKVMGELKKDLCRSDGLRRRRGDGRRLSG